MCGLSSRQSSSVTCCCCTLHLAAPASAAYPHVVARPLAAACTIELVGTRASSSGLLVGPITMGGQCAQDVLGPAGTSSHMWDVGGCPKHAAAMLGWLFLVLGFLWV
jgi:hypothetical protein